MELFILKILLIRALNTDFKAKLVLEVLEGEKTVNAIASKYDVLAIGYK